MRELETFRDYLAYLEARGDLVRVRRSVSPRFELAAVLKRIQDERGQAALFESVDGYSMPVAGNVYGSRERYGRLFGARTAAETTSAYLAASARPLIPPRRVDGGPVQEHRLTSGIDLRALLPVPTHYAKDADAFMTAGVVIARDPDTGVHNASVHRIQMRQGNRVGVQLVPNQDLTLMQQRAAAAGRALEVAVLIGPEPHVYAAAGSKVPADWDELAFAGALLGRPVDVVPCLTVDLQVPACTEIVLEGTIPPGELEPEGPMGEVLQYYGGISPKQVIEVSALTHRSQPIFQTVLCGSIEEHTSLGVPIEAETLARLRALDPRVRASFLPFFPRGALAVGPVGETEPARVRQLLEAALENPWIKLVVAVNDDVDIEDPDDIFWALSTRVDFGRDLLVTPAGPGFPMDPGVKDGVIHRLGIDATVPPGEADRYERRRVPGYEEIDLREYL